MKKIVLLLSFALFWGVVQAQDPLLADQYFENGEYEKASVIYEKLITQKIKGGGDFYFDRYTACLVNDKRWDEAEKALTKQIKKEPSKSKLYVLLGNVYEQQEKKEDSEKQYKKALEKLTADRFSIEQLANVFNEKDKIDLALLTYERGEQLMRDKTVFANNIAELYRRKGDIKKMTTSLLNGLDGNPENLGYCQMIFQRFFEVDEDYSYLKEQLYNKLQDKPDNAPTIELLAWVFLQKKDYKNAFRQLKALDRMQADEGSRIFEVAKNAENDKDYDAAIEGYNYISTEKGVNSLYNLESKRNMLNCKRKKLTDGYNYSKEELTAIEVEYETLLGSIGRHAGTASIMMELADMQAFYLNNLPKSIETLVEVIKMPNVQPQILAKSKISLGDFYLMQGENWEATLLYSQVDKAFKDDVLGHEARYRNAKLAYFKGDFDWAKAQFSVLKASTSKLISNDAIDMDVFIMDNSGLDSNYNAMLLYAEAELLVFQNRFNEAFLKMDSITQKYPKHALEDDLYYLKAKIYVKKKDFKAALAAYNYVVANYSDGIRADNSLFEMAELYENALNDKEKAKELYYKLFTEYDNSTLAVESRKKYRILRGDKVSQ